jgi:hypothetical protein
MESGMEARELDPKPGRRNTRVARIVAAWLAVLLALGLWQGYGTWLFGMVVNHGG